MMKLFLCCKIVFIVVWLCADLTRAGPVVNDERNGPTTTPGAITERNIPDRRRTSSNLSRSHQRTPKLPPPTKPTKLQSGSSLPDDRSPFLDESSEFERILSENRSTTPRPVKRKRQKLYKVLKRRYENEIAHPVCPSRTEWKQLKSARDINNTVVEVFQPDPASSQQSSQWFYTVSCRSASTDRECPGCCFGIDHSRYASSCQQKQMYVMALVRRPSERNYNWNWILVNSSCNCDITTLVRQDL